MLYAEKYEYNLKKKKKDGPAHRGKAAYNHLEI